MASFISSIISSIGQDGKSATQPLSRPAPSGTSGPRPPIVGQKRKAEAELERDGDKAQKVENGEARRDIKPLPRRSNTATSMTPVRGSTGVRTLGGPNSSHVERTDAKIVKPAAASRYVPSTQKPSPATSKIITASSTTSRPLSSSGSNRDASKTTTPAKPLVNKPAPKKGSFRAMLEKAKQSTSAQNLGQIVHKPTTSIKAASVKAQLAQAKNQAATKGKAVEKSAAKQVPNGKNGLPRTLPDKKSRSTERYQGTAKPASSKPQSTYQGTARLPSKPATTYRGTARPNALPSSRSAIKPSKSRNADEYLGTDEEDEDGFDDDDRYAYAEENSEDYSDMDAGYDDLANEEEEAERQARLDDLREQKELERLAREKAMRKASRG